MDAFNYINSSESIFMHEANPAKIREIREKRRKRYSYSAKRNELTEQKENPNTKLTKLNDVRFYKNFRGVKSNNLNSKVKIFSNSFLCSLRRF